MSGIPPITPGSVPPTPAERAAVLAKAKKLTAARKYQELADMGFEYIWAQDQELNALADTARDKLTQVAMAKSRGERKKLGVRIGMSAQDVYESSLGSPSHVNTRQRLLTPGSNGFSQATEATCISPTAYLLRSRTDPCVTAGSARVAPT